MKALKIAAATLGVVVVLGIVLAVSGLGARLFFLAFVALNEPVDEFDPSKTAAPPDYADPSGWAAHPDMEDPADLVPQGVQVLAQGEHPVDAFFIHPTGYLTSASWISPMDPDSGTEENTKWMMANQASAFNGCCNVYAPRYREANIFAYFGSEDRRDAVLGFAYDDVRRAFEHYLQHDNAGRPFVIATHSQGTHHAMRLLSELIDPSPALRERMVAAYTIGAVLIPLSPQWFASMQHIGPCQSERDLHCVMHWDTVPEGAEPIERPGPTLCTNPLTWRVDEDPAGPELNAGAVVPEGTFNTTFGRVDDTPTQQTFESLDPPKPGHTGARCNAGTLYAARQTDPGFASVGSAMLDSYHELDYSLFYMNVHNNARLRTRVYLDSR